MRNFLVEPEIGNEVIVIGQFPPPRNMPPFPPPSLWPSGAVVFSQCGPGDPGKHLHSGGHHGQIEFLPLCQEFGCSGRIMTQGGWGLSFSLDGYQH